MQFNIFCNLYSRYCKVKVN